MREASNSQYSYQFLPSNSSNEHFKWSDGGIANPAALNYSIIKISRPFLANSPSIIKLYNLITKLLQEWEFVG